MIVQYETNQYVLGKVPFIMYLGGQDIEDKTSDGFAGIFGAIFASVFTISLYVVYFFLRKIR